MSQPGSVSSEGPSRLGPAKWLIVSMAAIGFAFDIYELLMLPLIIRPALMELLGAAPGTPEYAAWAGRLFYFPAFAGGIFGLLGGYLTDRLGRRRVLTWSILLYAVSAFAAGFATSVQMLLVLRCLTFIGVCVEFVAAVAWLAELFPDHRQRERVLGYTQAFSSLGGLMVAMANSWVISYAAEMPAIALPDWLDPTGEAIKNPHAPWRYTLMSGLIPAFPLILIRPFLPESPVWRSKKAAGTLRRPSLAELFAPGLCRTTIVTALMVACSYGAAFGAIQQIPQIVPGLADVKERTAEQPAPKRREVEQKVAADYTKMQEIGGLAGRFLLAFLAVRILSRRRLFRVFQVPGLLLVPLVFAVFLHVENRAFFVADLGALGLGTLPVTVVTLGVFLVGLVTVAQFSFWGNYLPRVYPVHLRGTGESFAANIGGRMVGTSFAWVTQTLAAHPFMPGSTAPHKMAYAAAGVALVVYLVGSVACFFLPEPKHEGLLE